MGILSSTASITRYKVEGKISGPVIDTVLKNLKKNTITEIDNDVSDKAVGWTSLSNPFQPDFEGSSFIYKNLFVFTLRIDRKSIPPKLFKKHFTLESAKRLSATGRRFLARDEKQALKDKVISDLSRRIPAVPNVYDLIWNYEESSLWFFSNLKSANEELETLFRHSFNLALIRIFPYTAADLNAGLSDQDRDNLIKLSPTRFSD
jgi:DNA recombination-dependent growth factor C